MSDYKPLYLSLGMIFVVGILLPFMISSFIDLNNVEVSGIVTPIIDLVENGVSIFTFSINPFNIFGETIKNSIIDYLKYFSLIPDLIIIPYVLITLFGIFYTFIKMLPTT